MKSTNRPATIKDKKKSPSVSGSSVIILRFIIPEQATQKIINTYAEFRSKLRSYLTKAR